MKKQAIIIILLSGFLFQCTNTKQVKISGTIDNIQTDHLYVLNNHGDTVASQVPITNKKFDFTFDIDEENYYTLKYSIDPEQSAELSLYVKPKEQLSITIDSSKVTFSGNGAQRNQYLHEKNKYNWYSHWSPYYDKIERESFYRDSVMNVNKESVKALAQDSKFVENELKDIAYDYANFIFDTKTSADNSILEDVKWAKSIPTNNTTELRRSSDYIQLVAKRLADGDSLSMEMMNSMHDAIKHKNLQTVFISEFIRFMGPLQKHLQLGTDDYKKAVVIKEFVATKHPDLKEQFDPVFNVYQKYHNAEGKKASFSYEDVDGNMVDLRDFKGKYVYVDFWATWCSWCIKEFPKLKELKEKFKDENIEFVSISIDFKERKKQWKEYVIKNKLGDFHVIAPLQRGKTSKHTAYVDKGEIEDSFLILLNVNDYNVGIPQFSLIDPDGKVVDASAPRPSDEHIVEYLHQYLK